MRKNLAKWAVVLALTVSGVFGTVHADALSPATTPPAQTNIARERISLDKDWRFAFGHAEDSGKDFGYGTRAFFFAKAGYGDGPAAMKFDDRAWRQLDLPHDWAVELPFDQRGDGNHGSKAIGRNFPENSVGWYRKTIDIPASDRGRRVSLVFDGVYRDSVVWVNGHYIGTQPSGYTSFAYDISDYLNYGGKNVIAVRVDATREEGWFYEGAGIYRHVWMTKTAAVHLAQWGTFVHSTVSDDKALVTAEVAIRNDGHDDQTVTIEQQLYGPDGHLVADQTGTPGRVTAESETNVSEALTVTKPLLWSIDHPQLYRMTTIVRNDMGIVDTYDTSFGLRTVTFDADKGVFLNGQHIELKGIDNHQDFAGVGVAAPDALIEWRLRQLKKIGVNALRMSHNPPTPELLDAADRMGFLVIDEHRMMGTTPEIKDELTALVKRDRNHPSVFLWSVGNEEWALEGTELGTHLADEMQWVVHQIDPTRRTTAALSSSGAGVSLADDVAGFNYNTQHKIDAFHAAHPEKPSVMTEEGSTTATRGIYFDDPEHVHLAAYDREARPGQSSSIEEAWQFVRARPFISGMYVWTGFDYRGETTPFGWPAISSQFGMLDTTGVIKDSGYYLQSVWTEAPMVHLLPHWNWSGREGQPIDVWAYSNATDVELFLNGHSLGRKSMPKESHLAWTVPYAPGTLSAKAYSNDKLVATTEVTTAGAPKAVALSADKQDIKADGRDVSVLTVAICDDKGHIVPTADQTVSFEAEGPIRIIGVGNGDPGSHEADHPAVRYRYAALTNWRTLALNAIDDRSAAGASVDLSRWRDPFRWLPPEKQPPATEALAVRGEFAAPELEKGQSLQLFLARLADKQTVWLNGTEVFPTSQDGGLVLDVDLSSLRATNSLTFIIKTPLGGVPKVADDAQGGFNWATLRISTPPAPWQRSAFGGYAQVIVQSVGAPGRGIVHATSPGLRDASFTLKLEP
jgi:beta-galactosidase